MRKLLFVLVLLVPTMGLTKTRGDLKVSFRYLIDERVAAKSYFNDTSLDYWLNQSLAVVAPLLLMPQRDVDIIYAVNLQSYDLPQDFLAAIGVAVRATAEDDRWTSVLPNPFFVRDTSGYQYYITWRSADSARIYFRGDFSGSDSIRVSYVAQVSEMSSDTSECALPDVYEHFVIDYAMGFYFLGSGDKQSASAAWQSVHNQIQPQQRAAQ